ncbi:retropepsin-like aspartic protease [Prevotella sp. KH2C16]|uniref:retropepsin-like aspartic protease n=1 Tax=Prevotella sp. KH2C16 TaxID=1855325 RepID=UPI0015A5FEC8|nr:retropepsin-like aspartic protease [Prevotella sp. KH2C16]
MKRLFNILIVFALTLPIQAQETDSLVAACLNQSDWFRLQEVYRTDSSRISPFLRLFSKAMLNHFLGRPKAAVNTLRQLLRDYQGELGSSNLISLVAMLGQNYSLLDDNKQAAAVLQNLVNAYKDKIDSTSLAPYVARQHNYRGLSEYDLYQAEQPKTIYQIPFKVQEVGDSAQSLFFADGWLNGHKGSFVLDTGASYNVITPDLAAAYGLKTIDGSVLAKGIKTLEGQTAIAESLQIGDLRLRNVPFVVLDLQKGDRIPAQALAPLKLIIGQPLLRRFASCTFDFTQNTLTLHADSTVSSNLTDLRPNLCFTSGGVLQVNTGDGRRHYPLVLDSGATTSWMGPDYYKDHTADVAREGKWDIKGGAGYGGVSYTSQFVMPQITLTIGETTFSMKQIPVITMSTEQNNIDGGAGRLGNDFFHRWQQLTIDYTRMTLELK